MVHNVINVALDTQTNYYTGIIMITKPQQDLAILHLPSDNDYDMQMLNTVVQTGNGQA